jgi:general secretion pathway protein D
MALVAALWMAAPSPAQDEASALEQAIRLFEEGDYLAAQSTLVNIDRSQLNAEEQAARDDYLNRVQLAITMSEKAVRDLEDAETALAENEPEEARQLLEGILANEYAPQAVRRSAETHLRDLNAEEVSPESPAAEPAVESAEPGARVRPVDAQRARVLTEEADELVRGARYEEARRLYDEALRLVPGYPEAVAGLQRLVEHERNITGTRGRSLLDRIREENRIAWQRTTAEYRDVERAIQAHVAADRYEQAVQLLIRASQIIEGGRQFADPVTLYESLRNEFRALDEFVRAEERKYNERKVAEIQREVEAQRKKHLAQVEEERNRQVEALMSQAMQHRKDGDLEAAINVLKQVTIIDPKHRAARWMMDDLDELWQLRRARDLRDEFYEQSREVLLDVEEAKIPWHDELRYPKNWYELISRPDRQKAGEKRPGAHLYSLLEKRVPVDFDNEPLDRVIERLAEAHRVNLIVNWHDLAQAGVERTAPVHLRLPREIMLKTALTEVLEQVGGASAVLGFAVRDEAIKIATQDTLDRETYTAVYDINDLLMEVPVFNDAPAIDLVDAKRRATTASVQRTDKPWRYGDDDDDEPEEDPRRDARVQEIIDLIQETVAPTTWYERGGKIGTINEFNGQLVVTQNTAAQQEVGSLLEKLREQRAVQIAVEARFVTVSSHYLEELGIDIDIVFNSGNAGYDYVPTGAGPLTDPVLGNAVLLPRTFSRLGFTPASPGLGQAMNRNPVTLDQPYGNPALVPGANGGSGREATPIPLLNNITTYTDPARLGSDVPGSFAGSQLGPAFSIFGSFLDNIQVDFLLRATQADSRTTVLTAPRLVLMNGQRSWVAVTVQQSYVTQLQPVVATGAVAQAPQTGVIDSGAVLDVDATVTADRRYVAMTLRPGVTRLLGIQTLPFSGGGAGGGFGGGPALEAFIQLPTLSRQGLQTTVTVPDGGTLLIGGQKLASETEVEAGVPVLSKIPILKRAFESRSMIKDEQTLLILVKPKILIQTEQEEVAFPSFREG